jgi:pimeloyl-ACP methyl ester carboxylesterase
MMPLLLLPGLLCDAAVWAPLGLDASVVEYADAASITAMAEIALAAAPAGRIAVAGHSMGGRVAFEMHRLAPGRIERLALLNTGCHPLAPGEAGASERAGRLALLALARRSGMRAMARQWALAMVHPARIETPLFEAVLDMLARRDVATFEAQIQALLARPDAAPQLAQVTCPTLLLTGDHDTWSPPEQHRAMHLQVAGSRLVVVPDCGHMSTMEAPAAVRAALADWLAWPADGRLGDNPAP